MPNLASVMKDEISRIARKEIRAQTNTIKRSSTQHRRDIAELKRVVSALKKDLAFLRKQEKKRVVGPASKKLAEGVRFSPQGVKVHRKKVGLSAVDYARLVGVHAMSIYGWEKGSRRPRAEQLASLVAVRQLGKREAGRRLEMLG